MKALSIAYEGSTPCNSLDIYVFLLFVVHSGPKMESRRASRWLELMGCFHVVQQAIFNAQHQPGEHQELLGHLPLALSKIHLGEILQPPSQISFACPQYTRPTKFAGPMANGVLENPPCQIG